MAACDGNLELPGQIVEIGIACEELGNLKRQRRSINDFICIYACYRASGDVTCYISTRARGVQANLPQTFQHLRQRFDRHPMQLDILADGQIRDSVGRTMCQICDCTQLPGVEDSIWNSNADHEPLECAAFAAFSTGDSGAVSLCVNAPPAKVCPDPFGRNRIEAIASEAPDLLQPFPGILRALQTLDSLGLGLFHLC